MSHPSRASRKRPYEQIVIEGIHPSVDDGHHPVKTVAGEPLRVEATVFRHGHERLRVLARVREPGGAVSERPMVPVNPGLDRWGAELVPDRLGRYQVGVVAWTDLYASWVQELGKRVRAAQPDVASEVAEGLALVERTAAAAAEADASALEALLGRFRAAAHDPPRLLDAAADPDALELMGRTGPREDETVLDPATTLLVERERARTGAWYEIFVRSQGREPGRHATFRDAEARLADISAMGFDVLYLAPIHPIGETSRKGRNNSPTAAPGDPGSPWAIGSRHGGHMAVEPALGTLEDFDHFVAAAEAAGLEIAIDFAIQCSPDHPWVREHPDWFYRRPDGTIRYAENPPKKYEDIYPLNFDTSDWEALWEEIRRVVLFWVGHGVRIFRVDNPHTKPIGFWSWLIESVHREHPDVIFLAEAFTRPPMMQGLAKRGFTQSYTYFTWRNSKRELTEYLTELTGDPALYFRPNFFANTPDILPPILQTGGPAAFKSRLVLAATLAPSYGIYSGYELYEAAAIAGREEYLDSEKYEVKVRDWNAPGRLNAFIAAVNAARRDQPALQRLTGLRFLETESDQILGYVKATPDSSSAVIVVVALDPHAAQAGMITVPEDLIGVAPGEPYWVRDVLTGARYSWGSRNYVRLDPVHGEPAHLLVVERTR